jgi:hypothetical protein
VGAAEEVGPWLRGRAEGGRSAGLDPSVIPWLKQRDIAIRQRSSAIRLPISSARSRSPDFALLYLGVHLFDNCDRLEGCTDAAADQRWDFC